MAQYRLFVNSSTGVDIDPEYDYEEGDEKQESTKRSMTGKLYKYKWGTYRVFKFGVTYVNSSFMAIVNSWWVSNTELKFMKVGATQVYSVRIENNSAPIRKFIEPYDDQFEGKIELETY